MTTSKEENVPIDATAMQAAVVIQAAIRWRFMKGDDPLMNQEEWRLYEACNDYGDKFKGVK